jgi:hypothetical protein
MGSRRDSARKISRYLDVLRIGVGERENGRGTVLCLAVKYYAVGI